MRRGFSGNCQLWGLGRLHLLADWVAWLGLYHAAFCFIFSSSDVFIGLSLLGRVAGCTMLLLLNETETLTSRGATPPCEGAESDSQHVALSDMGEGGGVEQQRQPEAVAERSGTWWWGRHRHARQRISVGGGALRLGFQGCWGADSGDDLW
jgi:hypothetical protein